VKGGGGDGEDLRSRGDGGGVGGGGGLRRLASWGSVWYISFVDAKG